MAIPRISWYQVDNKTEISGTIQWGTIDAGTDSPEKVFHIWNNRNGTEDVSKMEDVTFTTRDRSGGLGNTDGSIVQAVRDNWFRVKVNSLDETTYTPVGSGIGNQENPTGVKALGTKGETINPKVSKASTWAANKAYIISDIVKPTIDNGFIYEVTVAGTTGGTQPTWATIEGSTVVDGTVQFVAIPSKKKPATQEILGVANSVLADGSNASNAGGNFTTITVFASVPDYANAGSNKLLQRVSYKYV